MNQLQSKTQQSGQNTGILIAANFDTLEPMKSHAMLTFRLTCTHKCTTSIEKINKSCPRLSFSSSRDCESFGKLE